MTTAMLPGRFARRGVAVLLWLATLFGGAQVADADEGYRFKPPWACRDVDADVVEPDRVEYLEALRTETLGLLDENQAELDRWLEIYSADLSRIPAGHEARLAAALQRERLVELLETREHLRDQVRRMQLAAGHANHVQLGILSVARWAERYPDRAEEEALGYLESLAPYGFVVVTESWTLDGQPVDLHDGRYYVDLNADLRPFLRAGDDREALLSNRLAQIDETVDRDYQRAKALLAWAESSFPLLDVRVEGSGLVEWIRPPSLGDVVGDPDAPFEEYWAAMRQALTTVSANIAEQRTEIRTRSTYELYDLTEVALARMKVLEAHPEYEGIDCIVNAEWGADDVRDTAVSVLGTLVGVGLTLAGQPHIAYSFYVAATFAGVREAARAFAAWRRSEQRYFTGVESPGLVTRALVSAYRWRFLFALGLSLVDGALAMPQAWRLYEGMLRSPGREAVLGVVDTRHLRALTADDWNRLMGVRAHSSSGELGDVFGAVRGSAATDEAARIAFQRYSDAVHADLTTDLFNGRVVDARPFSADGNRNSLFWARIENPQTGRSTEALFKPRFYGDGDGWNRVPNEYVAYEVNRMLGMDYVPPVAYRRNFDIDFERYAEGALMHKVADARPLRDVVREGWGADPDLFLSDAQILDVLLQNADRHAGNFMFGRHWVDGTYQPVLIDHGAALRPGTDIRLDVPGALSESAVTIVRRQTLDRLRGLNADELRRVVGEFVSEDEIAGILTRRDSILRYFDDLVSERGADAVIR